MAAFATYAVGFAARPIGGIVFGHYGDKLGRKTMLYLTLLMMGVATTAIGLLPTYASIGIWAPILLVAMRLLQGLGIGGEWGGGGVVAGGATPAPRGWGSCRPAPPGGAARRLRSAAPLPPLLWHPPIAVPAWWA